MIKKALIGILICTVALVWGTVIVLRDCTASARAPLTPIEKLGKFIFFDTNLSQPPGQACASCHAPDFGFSDPGQDLPVCEGANAEEFGVRNAPSVGYAAFTPKFDARKTEGGQFRDGRAADLIEQAKIHFLSPGGMNNPDKKNVIAKIMTSDYAYLFQQVFGFDTVANIDRAYHNIASAIAAYEGSEEFNPFTSKFDAYQAGLVDLTPQEELGEILFSGKAQCSPCHPAGESGRDPILFSDFDYHNIGVPRNTEYPYNLNDPVAIDPGLAGFTGRSGDKGKFKTPHLRNIARTAPYMHNGYFKNLKDIVHFFNTRDIPGQWPDPEIRTNLDSSLIGDLGLSDEEERAIVAFMLTFTDGYRRFGLKKYKPEKTENDENGDGALLFHFFF
jgi:cytochrome c peroxidase